MSVNAQQIKKINYFSKLPKDMCAKIAEVVELKKCGPKTARTHARTDGREGLHEIFDAPCTKAPSGQ